MSKALQSAQIGFSFRLTANTDEDGADYYKVLDEAVERIDKEMRELASFTSTVVDHDVTYSIENYEICQPDVDELDDETVYPVWFAADKEFSAQAREELEALSSRVLNEVAAKHGVGCKLLAREEFCRFFVTERTTTRLN
jgi:hypothetical protein